MDAHRLSELRSIAMHRVIAERIRADPSIKERAIKRVQEWRARGTLKGPYADRWDKLLEGPLDILLATLCADDESSRALRQCSPFVGVLSPQERWALRREVADSLS